MTRREAVLSALGIFVVAFLVRVVVAGQIVFPKPEDTAYYVGVARNLLEGRGLVSDALWSYGTPPLVFPRQAFEVWLPLPTLPGRHPDGAPRCDVRGGPVVVGPRRSDRAGPRLAAGGRRRGRTRAADRLAPGRSRSGPACRPRSTCRSSSTRALPDSTMPFAVLALAACLVMSRIAAIRAARRLTDPRVIGLGVLIGLAGADPQRGDLPRSRLGDRRAGGAGTWTARPGSGSSPPPRSWPASSSSPWAIRDWAAFGSPLPGQAAGQRAVSVTGFDIFAWNDPPTLSRYLAVGPARLLEMRVEGIGHNLFSVLLLLGLPISLIGLIGLPWEIRGAAIRPVVIVSFIAFLVTSLVFPVATTWGTFLHAAGPFHVLLVLSALLALDAVIARLGARLGWTRPVAWLGPLLGIFGSPALLGGAPARVRRGVARHRRPFEALAAGWPRSGTRSTRAPARSSPTSRSGWPRPSGSPSLALPDEPPRDVLDLAATRASGRSSSS